MAQDLQGMRIAIAGSRKLEEMSALIEKQGGIPLIRPLQGTTILSETEVERELEQILAGQGDWLIFTTGIGIDTLIAQAEKLGQAEKLLARMRAAKVASRGYKTFNALKRLGIAPVVTDEDGTTLGLIAALRGHELNRQHVAVQLHGAPIPKLIAFLEEKGAVVDQIMPYVHIPPEGQMAESFLTEVLAGELDAVCFTTELQVRYLFDTADRLGNLAQLVHTFNETTIAAAVGKVTAGGLLDYEVTRLVVPEHERMGAMIVALAQFVSGTAES